VQVVATAGGERERVAVGGDGAHQGPAGPAAAAADPGEKAATLVQKLGPLQPFIAAVGPHIPVGTQQLCSHRNLWATLASSGPI
jgi:hypothetical protein